MRRGLVGARLSELVSCGLVELSCIVRCIIPWWGAGKNVIDRVRTAIKYPTRDCNKDNESDSEDSDENDESDESEEESEE